METGHKVLPPYRLGHSFGIWIMRVLRALPSLWYYLIYMWIHWMKSSAAFKLSAINMLMTLNGNCYLWSAQRFLSGNNTWMLQLSKWGWATWIKTKQRGCWFGRPLFWTGLVCHVLDRVHASVNSADLCFPASLTRLLFHILRRLPLKRTQKVQLITEI